MPALPPRDLVQSLFDAIQESGYSGILLSPVRHHPREFAVRAPDSADDVRNGIALSPTYHRAYDLGIIYLDENYAMKFNSEREPILKRMNLDAGLPQFKATLGKILLPQDRMQWPNLEFIRKANRFREVTTA
ncbi:MAG: HNH endonuclease [Candidatus Hydrogenedentes bacterium]|nr:HNH endonuclease [Candidatus Hydrogenedentota bacterium]